MPLTRLSARTGNASTSASSSSSKAGSKRQANASPEGTLPQKSQKTLEETISNKVDDASKPSRRQSIKHSDTSKPSSDGAFVEDETANRDKIASNIIEKGIIYFFTRGRVNVAEPEGVQDLQRTYFVLRPIPIGAKLGNGPIDDSKRNRLLALPKKVFPETGKDRFMAFVEKAKASMSELKEQFFPGSDYETKAGETRHTPAVVPVGEGVYAITETGRNSHLAYMLTIPDKPGQVQDKLGICSRGSFVLSLKNPKNKGPANTRLPESPDFPQSIMDDFRGLAWMPVHSSEYLDYPGAQLLLIGEAQDEFSNATADAEGGEKGREDPEKELERLEEEDQIRVENLDGSDAVYKDLHVRKEEYSTIKTTW